MTDEPTWTLPEVTLALGAIRLAAIVIFGLILTLLPAHPSHFAAGSMHVAERIAPNARPGAAESALINDLRLHD